MLTKDEIKEAKRSTEKLGFLLSSLKQPLNIVQLLKNLGRLPSDFNGDLLLPFTDHENKKVRYWTVKNLGKLSSTRFINVLSQVVNEDNDSMIIREAVSSLGRMRHPDAKKALFEILKHDDPKVVLQAIRGLLVFKDDDDVKIKLRKLIKHPNEMISGIIQKQYFSMNNQEKGYAHTEINPNMKNVVVNGDVDKILDEIPDESIHLTFTSPPYYNARDYSTYKSYQHYLEFLDKIFKKIHRVTKEGRFFILNTSPIIIPRISRQHSSKRYPIPFDIHNYIVDMGWEFIDDIIWAKPETSVKNRTAGFMQHRKPLGYKPNPVTEYIMVYRKKTDRLLDWNIRQYSQDRIEASKVKGNYDTSNIWHIDPTHHKIHTAVFPIELCNRVIKYYSYTDDLVFDPFAGSGTLGKAAQKLNRNFFLTELNNDYFNTIKTELVDHPLFPTKNPLFYSFSEFKTLMKE